MKDDVKWLQHVSKFWGDGNGMQWEFAVKLTTSQLLRWSLLINYGTKKAIELEPWKCVGECCCVRAVRYGPVTAR